MDDLTGKLIIQLVQHFEDDARRIQHAVRVLHHALTLLDSRDDCDKAVVVASAILHDVGIKPAEEEYGYNNGPLQEEYGPPVAEAILKRIDFPDSSRQRVLDIIGNHHSAPRFDYPELALLREADQIVNRMEAG
jgi:HD superfamily phosphodiesterase